eukprot:2316428-Alexandrium_andersonii.AAC.1
MQTWHGKSGRACQNKALELQPSLGHCGLQLKRVFRKPRPGLARSPHRSNRKNHSAAALPQTWRGKSGQAFQKKAFKLQPPFGHGRLHLN